MLQIAVTGKPNVGKSSFLIQQRYQRQNLQNYPFTTIDANAAIAYVTAKCPCSELMFHVILVLVNVRMGIRYIPVELIDVAD